MKLHICCGDVYLENYINIDIKGHLARRLSKTQNPNITTIDKYYKYPFGSPQREFYVDYRLDVTEPWKVIEDNIADEVLMISSLEHFTPTQAIHILKEVHRVLKKDGYLKVDFPDIFETLSKFNKGEYNWDYAMRLIYCTHKNNESIHRWGYNKEHIMEILCTVGSWTINFAEIVEHDYPMIGCIARKDR
jgi:hypothetical protein